MSLDGLGGDFIIGSNARRQAAVQFGKTFASGLGVAAAVNWNETNGADLYYRGVRFTGDESWSGPGSRLR